jgi:hypothetical protein
MADAGLGRYQITQTLVDTGLAPAVAEQAAIAATSGQSADQIAVTLSNKFAGLKAPGSPQPNLYSAGASGVTNSVIGGANVKALETVQKYEDGLLAATEAKTVLDQARSEGVTGRTDLTRRVVSELTSQGVDAKAASDMADRLISNQSVGSVAGSVAETYPAAKLFGTANTLYKDADFVAQQVNDLHAQKLSPQQIRQTLLQEGIDSRAIDAAMPYRGKADAFVADQITASAQRAGLTTLVPAPAPAAAAPTETVIPPRLPQVMTEQAIAPGETEPSGPIRTTNAGVALVDVTQPEAAPAPAQTIPGYGNQTEAQMIAADSVQLAQQTNNNVGAIQQNLEYAGVDPVVAAEAANLAASGIDAATISVALGGVPGPTGAPAVGPSLYTNEPGAFTSQGQGQPPATYFPPPGAGFEQPAPEPPAEIGYDVGAIAATPAIPNPLEPPPVPQRPDMGTFTPAAPDPSWSQPLQYPGMNPGLVGAGIRPAYDTTSPVQAQYYYGRQPFFATADDLSRYGTSPFQPAQPFGIQQGYFEQPMGTPPTPVYGANLQPIAPQQLPTAGQIGGNEPLNQPIGAQQPVTPYEINPYLMPASFAAAQQNMLPYDMYQYQMPAQPGYVYNVAPQLNQYTVPGAAPVAA